MSNEELIATLEASLAALPAGSPAALGLSLHVASQQMTAGNPRRALELAQTVLAHRPSDAEALSIAALAAQAAGDVPLADEFRDAAAKGLGEQSTGPWPVPVVPVDGWGSDREGVRLADVAGMAEVKARLNREFLNPLANPALADAFSKTLRGGLLLWGPPGVGKTFIARALAGELGAAFISAGPADIYDSYFGVSEQNVMRLFTQARKESPCVVFLDELDALGGRRSKRHTDQARSTTNQLLTELDGMDRNTGIYLLAATNAPWDVDPALRRPGRIDRTVVVLPPDEPARLALLQMELRDRPVAPGVNIAEIARRTETYTGADLARIVAVANDHALERSITLGSVSPISDGDLRDALADTPASARPWFQSASGYVAYADDGEDYATLRDYMRRHRLG